MRRLRLFGILCFSTLAAVGSSVLPHQALAEMCEPVVAIAVSVQGNAVMARGQHGEWVPVRRADGFCPGDVLRVMERSRVDLLLSNETTLRLDQTTEIVFSAPEKKSDSWLDVLLGGAYFMSRTPRRFKVGTPFVNAGIEGTEFLVRVERDKAQVTVFEGKVLAANERGTVALGSGQTAEASAGQAPALRTVARPRDAVQWTLYYPVAVEPRPGAPKGWQERASELLSVGRVDEARGVIDEALRGAPGNADALALLAVIEVARNEKANALEL
ncbi:MAG: FecR domain-containing protein, partial [Verrucomicrobiota bacterium]